MFTTGSDGKADEAELFFTPRAPLLPNGIDST